METSYTVLALVLLASTFTSTFAAVAIGPAPMNEVCPGQCWDEGTSKCIAVGDSYTPSTTCSRAYCTSYKTKLFIEYATCGKIALPPGCRIVVDNSLAYPACCHAAITCDTSFSLEEDPEYQEFTNWLEEEYPGDDSFEI